VSTKMDKNDLKTPDMFLSTSDRFFHWMEQNARAIVAAVLVVLVGAIGFVGYGYWSEARELKAAEALFKPESELKEIETKLRESRAAKMQELAGLKKEAKAEPADYARDLAPIVEKMREQIKAHSNTKVALVSALNLSNFLMQQKQFSAALEVLDTPEYRPATNDLLSGFWHMHRGVAYLENQKPDEALKEYKSVLEAKALKYFHPEALLKTGVAHEMKGDTNKAREIYERLGREHQDTEAGSTAQQYLRLLELKPQQQG